MNTPPARSWPGLLLASFNEGRTPRLSKEELDQLAKANSSLWRALNIYDDFLDGEGVPSLLPAANRHYRFFLKTIYRAGRDQEFYALADRVLDVLDRANQRESKGRAGLNPQFLSQKSLALALAPIAALDGLARDERSLARRGILSFFRHALSAKQYADDAADCFADLSAGRITPAGWHLYRRLAGKQAAGPRLAASSYRIFIRQAAPAMSRDLERLCARARKALVRIHLNPSCPLADSLLLPLETRLQHAQKARELI